MGPSRPRHTFPHVTSSVGYGNQGQEDGAGGSPAWGPCSQTLNEEKVAPTPETNHSVSSVSARVSTSSSPRRRCHRFRLGVASHPLFWYKLRRVESLGLRRTDQKSLLLWVVPAEPWEGAKHLVLISDSSLQGRNTPNMNDPAPNSTPFFPTPCC